MSHSKFGTEFEPLEQREVPAVTLFDTSLPAPAPIATFDTASVELGTRFSVEKPGSINEIRFYRGAGAFDNVQVRLWKSDGTAIGGGIAPVNGDEGWKSVNIAPVNVVPGETYIASYFASSGNYAYTHQGFSNELNGLLLDSPAAAGVYQYGGGFPAQTYLNSNYWVTPVFTPAVSTYSLFNETASPSIATFDTAAVEVGTRFTVDVASYVDSIRLLPGRYPQTVTVHFWDAEGTLLATTSVYAGGESGARIVNINPVVLDPGKAYIVSYFSPNGNYAYSHNGYATAVDVGPLHAGIGAGVYVYGDNGGFPTQTYLNSNYWITPVVTPIS